jgi:hypothetical protein
MPAMTRFALHLGAPSHAVEPALLAQRVPRLAAALRLFAMAPVNTSPAPSAVGRVQVFAAQLGVQRDHVTLELLPAITHAQRQRLAAIAASLASEFACELQVLTGASDGDPAPASARALASLSLQLALRPAANYIGRDIAHALPRSEDARALRQFVNAAQMALHQSPVAGCAVNSLWCCNDLPTDALSHTWLQGGLSAWWDVLPAWDAALELNALHAASELDWVFSDVTLSVALKRRTPWALWLKPLELATLLQSNHA